MMPIPESKTKHLLPEFDDAITVYVVLYSGDNERPEKGTGRDDAVEPFIIDVFGDMATAQRHACDWLAENFLPPGTSLEENIFSDYNPVRGVRYYMMAGTYPGLTVAGSVYVYMTPIKKDQVILAMAGGGE